MDLTTAKRIGSGTYMNLIHKYMYFIFDYEGSCQLFEIYLLNLLT